MRIGDIFRFENLFTSAATREKFRSKYVENLIKIFVYGDLHIFVFNHFRPCRMAVRAQESGHSIIAHRWEGDESDDEKLLLKRENEMSR